MRIFIIQFKDAFFQVATNSYLIVTTWVRFIQYLKKTIRSQHSNSSSHY